jgi:hypothetical protein
MGGGFGPIPVEKGKAYSPEETGTKNPESLSRRFRAQEDTPWRRLTLAEKWSKRVLYEMGWRRRFGNGCGK